MEWKDRTKHEPTGIVQLWLRKTSAFKTVEAVVGSIGQYGLMPEDDKRFIITTCMCEGPIPLEEFTHWCEIPLPPKEKE